MGILRQFNPMLHKLNSVSSKIIFPYLLLTLIVAGVGAYVVTNLATSSLRERFDNQLLDAGRIVSESIVELEREQIRVHRTVTFTDGLGRALVERDIEELEEIIPPLALNNNVDLVSVLDQDGLEVFGWQRSPGSDVGLNTTLNDFSTFQDVAFVLSGQTDNLGDKRVVLAELNGQLIVFTVGPVEVNGEITGAVVVGDYLNDMVNELTSRAIARVTFYDPQGNVLASTLSNDFDLLAEDEGLYEEVVQLLATTPEQVKVVIESAEESVPLRELTILEQSYRLAYGDWRLRGRTFGIFSVALPSNFIASAVATSGRLLAFLFAISTMAVLFLGFVIARRIIRPLEQLVDVSTAVVEGDFERRTNIEQGDEIGDLARSFDMMTNYLVTRNREFAAQASNLNTILNSIADALVVLDQDGHIVNTNEAAREILSVTSFTNGSTPPINPDSALMDVFMADTRGDAITYELGERVYSVLSAPVNDAEQGFLGRVVVLRDI
ncbi:MAG: HAMP domain-containing protein, partial [Anaerolineales bacterium]|nr:HAMP domain-containing protein [Anaerolineales bacterium]